MDEFVIGLDGEGAKPQLAVLTYGLTAPKGGGRIVVSATKTGCIPVHLTEFSGGQRRGFISSSLVKNYLPLYDIIFLAGFITSQVVLKT